MPTTKPLKGAAGLLAATLIGAALSACSSSSTPPTTTTTTTTLPSVAASTTAIKHAYAVLFDLSDPAVAPKLAVVQDGSAIKSAMTSALKTGLAKEATGATTSKVLIEHGASCTNEILSSPCAKVTFDILGPQGKALLSNDTGFAVYKDRNWFVAKNTICALLDLSDGGASLPGC